MSKTLLISTWQPLTAKITWSPALNQLIQMRHTLKMSTTAVCWTLENNQVALKTWFSSQQVLLRIWHLGLRRGMTSQRSWAIRILTYQETLISPTCSKAATIQTRRPIQVATRVKMKAITACWWRIIIVMLVRELWLTRVISRWRAPPISHWIKWDARVEKILEVCLIVIISNLIQVAPSRREPNLVNSAVFIEKVRSTS